jgi:hypothetical protein
LTKRNVIPSKDSAGPKQPNKWYIEPDGSLDGNGKVTAEVVSAVYPLKEGLDMLEKTFKWMEAQGFETNDSTGLHVSFSIAGKTSPNDFDFLKMVVLFDENYTASLFDRLGEGYCKQMREVLFRDLQGRTLAGSLSSREITSVTSHLQTIGQSLSSNLGTEKYFSFRHRAKGVVEFRSMGGRDYETRFETIRKLIVNMAYLMKVGSDPTLMADEYVKRIYRMLTSMKYAQPTLGIGQGRVDVPGAISSLQPLFNRDTNLAKLSVSDPLQFVGRIGSMVLTKTFTFLPQQLRQFRFYIAKNKITSEKFRSAIRDDSVYNAIASLMRWPHVVPGDHHPHQQVLPFAQYGHDRSGTPNVHEPSPEQIARTNRIDRDMQRHRGQGLLNVSVLNQWRR